MSRKVLITGASGLLGRAIYKEFQNEGSWEILGLAFSRSLEGLRKVDITNQNEVQKVMKEFSPSIVIHSAAERKPDVVEKQPEATQVLNVTGTRIVCEQAAAVDAWVLYISTDYVFDGTSPPYAEDASPNPLNKYGQTKFDGEKITMEINQDNSVLRVPILYGDVENLDESAVTTLFHKVKDTSKTCVMSHYERRFPTYVNDIALVIRQLAERRMKSYTWPFYQPVDPVELGLYDYFDIIRKPMDLSTVKNNLECGLYQTADDFSVDMRLIYHNCYTYSLPDTEIYKMAQKLEDYFEQEFKKLKSKFRNQNENKQTDSSLPLNIAETQIKNLKLEDSHITGVYHFSGEEMMTKYDMAVSMAECFNLGTNHIQPDESPSTGANRPYNAQLSCQRIKDLGIFKTSSFKETIFNVLRKHYKT